MRHQCACSACVVSNCASCVTHITADIGVAMGYDTQKLIALALERAGRDLTIDKFLQATETIKDWQDIFGSPPLTFGPSQHVGTRTTLLTRIQGGKFKRLTGALM